MKLTAVTKISLKETGMAVYIGLEKFKNHAIIPMRTIE